MDCPFHPIQDTLKLVGGWGEFVLGEDMGYLGVVGGEFGATGFDVQGAEGRGFFEVGGRGAAGSRSADSGMTAMATGTRWGGVVVEVKEGKVVGR